MICDKIFYMTFNDLRKNAYKSSVSQNVAQKKFQVQKEDLSSQKEKSKKEKHKSQNPELNAASDALVSGGLLKVPVSKKEADGRDSVYRRVAKFLLIIGVDEAAKILPHLTEEQTEKIIPEIASIRSVSPEETRQILEEFETLLKNAREGGGIDTAREILRKAYGEKKAKELIDKSVPFPLEKPFEYLNDIDNERINLLLKEESVQVKALILSHLNPKKAASVINLMDSKEKSEVAFRLLKLEPVSPEVIKNLDEVLKLKKQLYEGGIIKYDDLYITEYEKINTQNELNSLYKQRDILSHAFSFLRAAAPQEDINHRTMEEMTLPFLPDTEINSDLIFAGVR